MAYTLNRRLAQLVDSNGQLNTGKIPNDYISSDHIADNVITSAMLHTSFTVSTSNLTSIDTDDVSEGTTNLYFTNARVDTEIDSYLSGGTGVTYSSGAISIGQDVSTTATPTFGNITTTGYIAGPATFTIDPAAVGDNTGTVVIAGNLQVDGTTTTINSTTMTVDDLNITLASGAANAAAANGAGITVDTANATITYNGTIDSWEFNKDVIIGVNDTTPGALVLYGGATGNAEGGEIRIHTSADHDATYDHYRIDTFQDDFRIGRAGTTDLYIFDTGRIRAQGNFEAGGTIKSDTNILVGLDTTNDIGMQLEKGDSAVTTLRFDSDRFRFYSGGTGGAAEIISIREGGHVGIGTNNNTDARLHIQGNSDNGDSDCQLIIEDSDTDAGSQIPSIQFMANGNNTVRMRGTSTQGLVISGSSAQGDDLVVQAGAVGIGTDNPNSILHVKNTSADAKITLETSEDYDCWINFSGATSEASIGYEPTNNLLVLANAADGVSNSSTQRLVINSSGQVGIGTNNPQHKLEIITGSNTDNAIKIGVSTSDNEKITLGHFNASITNGLASILAGSKFGGIIQGGENGKLVLGIRDNDDSDSVDIVSGSGNYMTDNTYDKLVATFRANGYVGIGVHPQAKLDVNGTLRFTPNTADTNYSADILARYDSTHPFELSVKNNGSSAEYMGVYANSGGGSERVVFPTGYVGIGTTSIVNNAKLNIVGGGINVDSGIVGANVSDAFTFRGRTHPHYGANFSPTGATDNHISISGYYGMSFVTAGLERLTIKDDGNIGIGQTSPDQKFVVRHGNIKLEGNNDGNNAIIMFYDVAGVQSGQIYPSSGDLRIWSPNDVLLLQTGKVGIGQDTPAEKLHVSGTIRHQAPGNSAYYANRTYLGDTFTFGTSETTDNVDFKIAGGAFTRTTTGGKFRFYTQTGNGTPSERMSISAPGTVHTPIHAQGAQSSGQLSFEPGYQGYLGDDLMHGLKTIYHVGTAYSSASTNAQSNYFNIYRSGHWSQYTQVLVWMINLYYTPGFAKWHVNAGTVTNLESWGSSGAVSVTETLVGNGTHSGQSVYRYNVTLENPGAYHTTQWYVGLVGGGSAGHLGNSRTIAQADSWFSTRGGGLHLINCADTYIQASPMYSTGT